ncbi:MAG: YihY/virulence factor BrkB family protein [Gemmatimonadota bacterium]
MGPSDRGLAAAWRAIWDFARRLYRKAGEDNIFFLAGAIAFNLLVAFVPLVLAVLGMAGTVLRARGVDSAALVLDYVRRTLPALGEQLEAQGQLLDVLGAIVDNSAGFLGLGTLVLAWVATRLVGTLRTVLREIFDIHYDRGIVRGKLFDLKMVLTAGTLFTVSVLGSLALQIVAKNGFHALGLEPGFPAGTQVFLGQAAAFTVLWTVFLLTYHFLPARRPQWRTSLIAATFAAIAFQALRSAFGWYATNVASYASAYGSVAFLFVLILWIYYSSVVFVLGGEVAQVAMQRRTRRRQKERLG